MRSASFIARTSSVPVLAAIALVLFCMNFLRFVTLHFADDAPHHSTFVAPTYLEGMQHTRCGYDDTRPVLVYKAQQELRQARLQLLRLQEQQRRATTIQQELKLRAAQNPEVDETLRNQLGLDGAPIPIMR